MTAALHELNARTGVDPLVVFDGIEAGPAPPGSHPFRTVRVRFTAAEVEADDELLELVGQVPVHLPVVVASSDNRVRAGAAARGANVISSAQLRTILGR